MHELSVALAARDLTGDLARSALPDAPVVAERPRKARRWRRPIVGGGERRTVAPINEEVPCGT
jgi:hypothetical protein